MEHVNVISHKAELDRRRNSADGNKVKRLVLQKPIKEMITTSQGALDLIQKVRVDVEFGQAEVPLLYTPLYERIEGPFPGRAVQLGENLLQANIVFLEKFEGGEVNFGVLSRGTPKFVTLQTYAAAFEYTEDMVEWDSTFELEMLNRSMGRAYNYLLNHLHLSPIIAYTYTTGAASNTTPYDTAGATTSEKTLNTFRSAYQTAVSARPQRTPSVILASESDRFQIEDALLAPHYDVNGNPLPRVPVDTIIYYDGASITVGLKTYTYSGVTPGTAYFIMPGAKLKEFVHHDLRVDAGNDMQDISRLIEAQIVGRARRGLYGDYANSVQKVLLA